MELVGGYPFSPVHSFPARGLRGSRPIRSLSTPDHGYKHLPGPLCIQLHLDVQTTNEEIRVSRTRSQ